MRKSNDNNGEEVAVLVAGLALALVAVFFIVNGLAFLMSESGFWIGQLGRWPMQFLHTIGLANMYSPSSAAITQALGWFAFFLIIGSIGAALIAHAILPAETPKIAYEEDKISRWIFVKISVCIVIFLIFVYILWKY